MNPDNAPRIDSQLKEALRHAPDAGLEAPSAVSQHILQAARLRAGTAAQARVKAGVGGARPAWLAGLAQAWAWLGNARAAGALASLMVATVLGLMWWDTPPEEALPARSVPALEQPAPAPVQAPEPALPADASPKIAAPAKPAPAAAASDEERQRRTDGLAERARSVDEARQAKEQSAGSVASASRSAETADRKVASQRDVLNKSAPPAPAPAPPPPEAPPVAAAPMPAPVRISPPGAHSEAAARAKVLSGSSVAPAVDLRELMDSLAAPGSAWSWQPGGLPARPVTSAFNDWMGRLQAHTAGRWSVQEAGAPAGPAAVAHWWVSRDGSSQGHEFTLAATQLRWQRPDGSVWVALVEAPVVAEWVQTLVSLQ